MTSINQDFIKSFDDRTLRSSVSLYELDVMVAAKYAKKLYDFTPEKIVISPNQQKVVMFSQSSLVIVDIPSEFAKAKSV